MVETRPIGHPGSGTGRNDLTATGERSNVATSERLNVALALIGELTVELVPAVVDPDVAPDRAVLPSDQLAPLAAVAAQTAPPIPARGRCRRPRRWCYAQGYPALPAAVAAYITAAAVQMRTDRGRFAYAPATLTRWASSINQVHGAADYPALLLFGFRRRVPPRRTHRPHPRYSLLAPAPRRLYAAGSLPTGPG